MPALGQTGDLTKQYLSYNRQVVGMRANPGVVFPIGTTVKLLSQDLQQYPDAQTVGLPSTAASQQLIIGIVSEIWPGFDGNGGTTAPSALARGTTDLDVTTVGYHPAALVDQSGAAATAVTNETCLIPSRATAGYLQGVGTAVGALGTAAVAMLPASGLFSNLTAAALAQATQTATIGGVPAIGDVYSATLQVPYTTVNPGVVQTRTFSNAPLIAGQQTSVTTAALAFLTQFNADPILSKYYFASQVAGAVTFTVVQGAPFLLTFGSTAQGVTAQLAPTLSGSGANGLTITAATVTGTGTTTAGGGTFAGGTGFKGSIPVFVV